MALAISWHIEGEAQLVRRLRGIEAGLKDWSPAFQQTARELKDIFSNDVFQSEGRAIGEQWQPLTPSYAAQKARKYPGKGILEASGHMRQSFKSLFKPDMAAVWNTASYFKYHQSNKPRSRLPRRAMMRLAEEQRQLVVKIFHTHFQAKMKTP